MSYEKQIASCFNRADIPKYGHLIDIGEEADKEIKGLKTYIQLIKECDEGSKDLHKEDINTVLAMSKVFEDQLEAKDKLIEAAKVQAKELTHRLMCGYDLEPVDVYRLYDALGLDRNQ